MFHPAENFLFLGYGLSPRWLAESAILGRLGFIEKLRRVRQTKLLGVDSAARVQGRQCMPQFP
jgi:hypothetical protein